MKRGLSFNPLLIVLVTWISQEGVSGFKNAESQLYRDLFNNYSSALRPLKQGNYMKEINVHVQFYVNQIQSLNERDQRLTASGFLTLKWMDELLSWNSTEYDGAFALIVPATDVWLPEITPVNSAFGTLELASLSEDSRVRILPDGTVTWVPSQLWETICIVNVANFPYDQQQCEVQYANWMYTAYFVNFTAVPYTSMAGMEPSLEWIVTGIDTWTERFPTPQDAQVLSPFVNMRLHLKRDPRFFELNILVPTFLLAFLMIPMFMMPVESGEKIGLGITIMLAFSIFQLMMIDITPRSGNMPKLAILILTFLIFAGVSLFMTGIIINIHHHSPEKPVPRWIKILILDKLARLLCCMHVYCNGDSDDNNSPVKVNSIKVMKTNDKGEVVQSEIKDEGIMREVFDYLKFRKSKTLDDEIVEGNRDAWNKVARVLDRLLLCIYVVFLILAIIIVILIKYGRL